ncbi:MAG: protein YgfX [Noviherbaspirillum sp.]
MYSLHFPRIMSIAVSAIVQPSRLLFAMVGAMSLCAAAVGVAIGAGQLGALPINPRILLSACSIFLAVFGFYHGVRHRKILHIDISGAGQLRLMEVAPAGACTDTNWPHVSKHGEVVRLLANSTIWPQLLLLRLQADSGKITTVPILPDCVSPESFRALSVACRWIAARNQPPERSI